MTLVILRSMVGTGSSRSSRIRILISIVACNLNSRPLGAGGCTGTSLQLPSAINLLPQLGLEGRDSDVLSGRDIEGRLIGIDGDTMMMEYLGDETSMREALLGVISGDMHVTGNEIPYI